MVQEKGPTVESQFLHLEPLPWSNLMQEAAQI
jgi:hypothetical protein